MFKINLTSFKCFRNWTPIYGHNNTIININVNRHILFRPTQTFFSNPCLFSFSCDILDRHFNRTFSTLKIKPSIKESEEHESKVITNIKPVKNDFIELDDDRLKTVHNPDKNSININSSIISKDIGWKDIPDLTAKSTLNHYAKLGKIKLTGLVALTTLAGTFMGTIGSIDYVLLSSALVGTALTSCSAAAFNHFLEVPFDSQMKRTQDRPLVQGLVTPLHAATFAALSGVAGITILATCVNSLTATLGALNLGLYSFIYTPMKRVHIVNTWVGAVVGAIPPVMGFTAVTGVIDLSSILLGLLLYSWQFPHFNALSWNMRHEYARAGYRMMSVTDPKLCQNTALRHSLFLLGITTAMCCTQMTHWSFGVDSLPFTLYLVYLSYKFRQDPSSKTSRKLFFYTLIYLPVVMLLMSISKNRPKTKNSTTEMALN